MPQNKVSDKGKRVRGRGIVQEITWYTSLSKIIMSKSSIYTIQTSKFLFPVISFSISKILINREGWKFLDKVLGSIFRSCTKCLHRLFCT